MRRALKAAWLLSLLLAFSAAGRGQTWEASVAALAAGQALDAVSSWGRVEANPVMGRVFGVRALGIKAGATTGVVLLERYLIRRDPHMRRSAIIVNLVCAGVLTAVAAKNWRSR